MGREERGQEGKEKIEKNEVMVGEGGRRRGVEGGRKTEEGVRRGMMWRGEGKRSWKRGRRKRE